MSSMPIVKPGYKARRAVASLLSLARFTVLVRSEGSDDERPQAKVRAARQKKLGVLEVNCGQVGSSLASEGLANLVPILGGFYPIPTWKLQLGLSLFDGTLVPSFGWLHRGTERRTTNSILSIPYINANPSGECCGWTNSCSW